MKKGLYILFTLCLIALVSCGDENTTPPVDVIEVGDAVPAFSVLNSAGAPVAFDASDFKHTKTLIVFFVTTCKDCQRELPKVQAAWEALESQGLQLIMISRGEDTETVADYWTKAGFTMPWYIDPDLSAYSKFASHTVPRLYLVDDNGFVKWKAVENLDLLGIKNGADLAAKIEELGLFRKAVEVGSSVPTFTVKDENGNAQTFTSQDFLGKKSLIVFFVTTCSDCQREMPKVQAAWEALESEALQLITIARSQPATLVRTYWNSAGFDMPWYVETGSSTYYKFANKYVPRFYLVDQTGVVVWTAVENLEMTAQQLIAKINEFN